MRQKEYPVYILHGNGGVVGVARIVRPRLAEVAPHTTCNQFKLSQTMSVSVTNNTFPQSISRECQVSSARRHERACRMQGPNRACKPCEMYASDLERKVKVHSKIEVLVYLSPCTHGALGIENKCLSMVSSSRSFRRPVTENTNS